MSARGLIVFLFWQPVWHTYDEMLNVHPDMPKEICFTCPLLQYRDILSNIYG